MCILGISPGRKSSLFAGVYLPQITVPQVRGRWRWVNSAEDGWFSYGNAVGLRWRSVCDRGGCGCDCDVVCSAFPVQQRNSWPLAHIYILFLCRSAATWVAREDASQSLISIVLQHWRRPVRTIHLTCRWYWANRFANPFLYFFLMGINQGFYSLFRNPRFLCAFYIASS